MKTMKLNIRILWLLVVLLLGLVTRSFGQQDPHYTQYMYNMEIINPAYTATNEATMATLLARSQWVGIEGAPKTATFSLSGPVGRNVGLGLSVIHDEVGPVIENNLFADFSYTLRFTEASKLALGLKAGMTFLDVDLLDPDDETDPLNVPIHLRAPNFGFGAFYFNDRFYVGLSLPNILETKHMEKTGQVVSTAAEVSHYFLTTGIVFDLSDNLKFKPSAMVKAAPGSPISLDLSANLLINEMLELGASYRFEDSASAMIGLNVTPDFRVGYAYDRTLTAIGDYNSGSHEIMLSYTFNRLRIKSPRFF